MINNDKQREMPFKEMVIYDQPAHTRHKKAIMFYKANKIQKFISQKQTEKHFQVYQFSG